MVTMLDTSHARVPLNIGLGQLAVACYDDRVCLAMASSAAALSRTLAHTAHVCNPCAISRIHVACSRAEFSVSSGQLRNEL